MFAGFLMSFTDYDILMPPRWVGLGNYVELFTRGDFWLALKNTFIFALIYLLGGLAVGLGLALLLNTKVSGIGFFRALFFSPLVTSSVAIGLVWNWILSPRFGVLNYILKLMGLTGPSWLGDSSTALASVATVFVWKESAFYMIIYLAGLQDIPLSLYEAAEMDGASKWQRFWRVTFPLLTPTTFFALTIAMFRMLQHFDLIYAMTRGGPGMATTTLPYAIYLNAFVFYRMGYASAMAFVFALLVGFLILLNFLSKKYWVRYQY
jgi:multiple sugar transport system permease protein